MMKGLTVAANATKSPREGSEEVTVGPRRSQELGQNATELGLRRESQHMGRGAQPRNPEGGKKEGAEEGSRCLRAGERSIKDSQRRGQPCWVLEDE